MKFWFSAALWSLFVVVGCAMGIEIWAQYGGRGTSTAFFSWVLALWALALSGVICIFLRVHRDAPPLARLKAWLSSLTR